MNFKNGDKVIFIADDPLSILGNKNTIAIIEAVHANNMVKIFMPVCYNRKDKTQKINTIQTVYSSSLEILPEKVIIPAF